MTPFPLQLQQDLSKQKSTPLLNVYTPWMDLVGLELWPSKWHAYVSILTPEPGNRTSLGNRIFADVMQWRVWDEVLLDEGGPTSNDRVLLRDRRGETQTQRRSPEKTEAETGETRPQAQGRLEPPEAGRGRKDPPLETLEGPQPWDTLTSDIWSPGWGRLNFPCFKLPCFWYFVAAALGK